MDNKNKNIIDESKIINDNHERPKEIKDYINYRLDKAKKFYHNRITCYNKIVKFIQFLTHYLKC